MALTSEDDYSAEEYTTSHARFYAQNAKEETSRAFWKGILEKAEASDE
jgi:hypothetical protein